MLHCIGNYEQNLYHDSYFYSVFWDDEKKEIVKKEIGSTAFGGGAYSTALTSNERVWAEVKKYREDKIAQVQARKRKKLAERFRKARTTLKEAGVHTAFSRRYNILELEDLTALFSPRVRNSFKKKMQETVRQWKPGGKYPKPLSAKQFACVRRPLKDPWGRPTSLANKHATDQMIPILAQSQFRGIGSQ